MAEVVFRRFHLDEEELKEYREDPIAVKKRLSEIDKEVRKEAKAENCYYCKKQVDGFCNSHSVPRFCLKRIATNGDVYLSSKLIDVPFIEMEEGVKKAGTFQIICRKCDSRVFQQYESPEAYSQTPNGQVLAQIAMKNLLQLIAKRRYELVQNRALSEKDPWFWMLEGVDTAQTKGLDLGEYEVAFFRAKVGSYGKHNSNYRILFARAVDYVVPVAAQTAITMICDFEGNVINNIYNLDNRYHTEMIHIAIFPLESSSVILAFVDSRHTRYRRFAQQLNALEPDDQLLAVLYIILIYSENVFFSKEIETLLSEDQGLRAAAQMDTSVDLDSPVHKRLSAACAEFDLSRRHTIPNLLSEEYALFMNKQAL